MYTNGACTMVVKSETALLVRINIPRPVHHIIPNVFHVGSLQPKRKENQSAVSTYMFLSTPPPSPCLSSTVGVRLGLCTRWSINNSTCPSTPCHFPYLSSVTAVPIEGGTRLTSQLPAIHALLFRYCVGPLCKDMSVFFVLYLDFLH